MNHPIRGRVARILNKRELVINVGSEAGVTDGMTFAVLNRRGAEIKDPETGEDLGSVPLPKVLVKTVRVQPRLSVARTFRTRRRNIGGTGFGVTDLFRPPEIVEEPETLQVTERTYVEELDEEDSFVKTGDPVVQVRGNEFDLAAS